MLSCRKLTLILLFLLHSTIAAADGQSVEQLGASDLAGEPFLGLIREESTHALCALASVRTCLDVSEESCARGLARNEERCIAHIRRLIKVTGVRDRRLNETLFADYATCLMDGTAMARLLNLESARQCLTDSSPVLAELFAGQDGSR